jgi:hypothetical protein
MQGEDTMPGDMDKVEKVQGDGAVDVDAKTADVYHLLSTWRKEEETQGPQVPLSIPMRRA